MLARLAERLSDIDEDGADRIARPTLFIKLVTIFAASSRLLDST